MNIDFRDAAVAKWHEYFPQAEMPVAVFYSDYSAERNMPLHHPKANEDMYACLPNFQRFITEQHSHSMLKTSAAGAHSVTCSAVHIRKTSLLIFW